MCGRSQIAHADQIECLREVDVAAVFALLVYVDRQIGTNLTRGHIDILIGILITEDDAAQELCLAYQNISLRQSI